MRATRRSGAKSRKFATTPLYLIKGLINHRKQALDLPKNPALHANIDALEIIHMTATAAFRTGWRGNDLGLLKWQVEHVHEERLKMVSAVQRLVLAGKSFEEAKQTVTRRHISAWSAMPLGMGTALQRCADDLRFSDMSEPVFRAIEEQILQHHGKRSTWLRRLVLRWTGLVL